MKIEIGATYINKANNVKVKVEELDMKARRVTYIKTNVPRTRYTVSFIDFMTKYRPV